MSTDEAAIGFDSPAPRTMMPNSVSTPMILRNAINRTLPARHPTASARNEIVSPRAVEPFSFWLRNPGSGHPISRPERSDGLLADPPRAVGLADAGDHVPAERGAGTGLVGLGQGHLDVLRGRQVAHQPPEVGVAGVLVPDLVPGVDRERPAR